MPVGVNSSQSLKDSAPLDGLACQIWRLSSQRVQTYINDVICNKMEEDRPTSMHDET